MGSNSKRCEACIEDRISGLPEAVLCHILSFLPTVDSVKTSILSHRWKNVWASVPVLDLRQKYYLEDDAGGIDDPHSFAGFVDRVLFFRDLSNIHSFRLQCIEFLDYSRITAWICTAIRHNVVELDLCVCLLSSHPFELPRSIFTCNTLVVLKLRLESNYIATIPTSHCFPTLKFLDISVYYPDVGSLEKLCSGCPALEDLIIGGILAKDSVLNINVSAPNLKRPQISFSVVHQEVDKERNISFNADAPNLENFSLNDNHLGSYSLRNANSLGKADIDFRGLHVGDFLEFPICSADRMQRLFAGIANVEYLSVSGPLLGDPYLVSQYCLPTLNNLHHLELFLRTCCSWQLLARLLNVSPNMKYLVFEKVECERDHNKSGLVHEWPTMAVPTCLLSSLKTICIRRFQGR